MPTLLAQLDTAFLMGLGGMIGGACTGAGVGIRWWLTRKDGNEKTLIAGLWEIIHAKDEQIKAQDANCEGMKVTFNALVVELNRTRLKHGRCEAKILELRQCAETLHGTLKDFVRASATPDMYIANLPEFREEDWEIDDESKSVDKQVKEVVQNEGLLEANKKLTQSSMQGLPKSGGKP
jgi:hypothetical protein